MTKAVDAARRRKTLDRKLRDLDDQLYFLRDALSKLAYGDASYLKMVAGQLRVLVCKASSEGLIWRILPEVGGDDTVEVHAVGKFDFDNPITKNIGDAFFPLFRAGIGFSKGHPAGKYSLHQIIKEHDALVFQGKAYGHEKLIRAVAEQMGTSHEDEGVQSYLIDLSEIFISDVPVLSQTLMMTADLVLEVGERVLITASKKYGFIRKSRAPIHFPKAWRKHLLTISGEDFEDAATNNGANSASHAEGSIFLSHHARPVDWATDKNNYEFTRFVRGQISIDVKKNSDWTLEIDVAGLNATPILIRKMLPPDIGQSLRIAVTWNEKQADFYLNGSLIEKVSRQ